MSKNKILTEKFFLVSNLNLPHLIPWETQPGTCASGSSEPRGGQTKCGGCHGERDASSLLIPGVGVEVPARQAWWGEEEGERKKEAHGGYRSRLPPPVLS